MSSPAQKMFLISDRIMRPLQRLVSEKKVNPTFCSVVDQLLYVVNQIRHKLTIHHVDFTIVHGEYTDTPENN